MVLFLEESRNKFCKEEKWRGNYNRQMRQIAHLKMWGGCNLQPHWLLFPKTREWWIHLVFSINHTTKVKISNLGGTQTIKTRDTLLTELTHFIIEDFCLKSNRNARKWEIQADYDEGCACVYQDTSDVVAFLTIGRMCVLYPTCVSLHRHLLDRLGAPNAIEKPGRTCSQPTKEMWCYQIEPCGHDLNIDWNQVSSWCQQFGILAIKLNVDIKINIIIIIIRK